MGDNSAEPARVARADANRRDRFPPEPAGVAKLVPSLRAGVGVAIQWAGTALGRCITELQTQDGNDGGCVAGQAHGRPAPPAVSPSMTV